MGIIDVSFCVNCGHYQCVCQSIYETMAHVQYNQNVKFIKETMAPLVVKYSKDDLIAYLTAYMGDSVFATSFAECIHMMKAKNADYSQGEQKGDRIAAFRRIAKDVNITMLQAWAVFCQKHWGAVMKFVKEGSLESEPIYGRIHDVINYMVLLSAIVEDMASDNVK